MPFVSFVVVSSRAVIGGEGATGRLVITHIDQELRGKIYAEFAARNRRFLHEIQETNMSLDNTSHERRYKDEHTRNSKENLTTR